MVYMRIVSWFGYKHLIFLIIRLILVNQKLKIWEEQEHHCSRNSEDIADSLNTYSTCGWYPFRHPWVDLESAFICQGFEFTNRSFVNAFKWCNNNIHNWNCICLIFCTRSLVLSWKLQFINLVSLSAINWEKYENFKIFCLYDFQREPSSF